MGNDLSLVFNGDIIAGLGRKHNYTFCGNDPLPTKEEIKETLDLQRNYLVESMIAYSTYLLTNDKGDVTEELDYLVEKIKARIDVFEEMIMVAGRNEVLLDMTDEFNEENLEIMDDFEVFAMIKNEGRSQEDVFESLGEILRSKMSLGKEDFDLDKVFWTPEDEDENIIGWEKKHDSLVDHSVKNPDKDDYLDQDDYLDRQNRN